MSTEGVDPVQLVPKFCDRHRLVVPGAHHTRAYQFATRRHGVVFAAPTNRVRLAVDAPRSYRVVVGLVIAASRQWYGSKGSRQLTTAV